jgi:hypothetical protein
MGKPSVPRANLRFLHPYVIAALAKMRPRKHDLGMKSKIFLLLFAATLSCRAEPPASPSADRPVQKVESAKPAPVANPVSTPAKAAEPVVPVTTPDAASQKVAPEKSEPAPAMVAFVVKGSTGMKLGAPDMKKDLSDALAEQKATMALQLADEAKNQKAAFATLFAAKQPVLALPSPANLSAPTATIAPPAEAKKLEVAALSTK